MLFSRLYIDEEINGIITCLKRRFCKRNCLTLAERLCNLFVADR